ncbi:RNA polymerase sigma factor [Rhodopirellula sp. JC639]|uniref:RNA polymerase sigma factor n=1 Tax=Stieleria mannarensis TaxID=2755585 RepID=UPI00160149EA|nr:sigma-70 family RNA polymerase sigma factor [Rhodopirellula sp. JC639]
MIAPSHFHNPDDLDAKLMLRLRNGDCNVFERLVRRNRPTVLRFIRHFQTPEIVDPEDLTQQVFLRVYRSRHTYQPTAKFSSWLYTITRNVVSNTNRQLARRREVPLQRIPEAFSDPQCSLEVSVNSDPAVDLMRRECRVAVQQAISRLGQRQQAALRLVHFHGYSYLAAAQELMLSEMALKSLVQRARAGLKKALQKEHGEEIDDMLRTCIPSRRSTFALKRS